MAAMVLNKISLQDFRSYHQERSIFSNATTLIVGPNAIGKSNLVEAVALLATGKSYRAGREAEMIGNGAELARISGEVTADQDKVSLEVVVTRGQLNGGPAPRKRLLVNGVSKRLSDFAGNLRVVLFQPEDLNLIIGSPSRRRDYLDFVLSQISREYYRCSLVYQQGLRRRNKLLTQIREGEAKPSQLEYWDRTLIKNGQVLHEARRDWLAYVNRQWGHTEVAQLAGLQVEYRDSVISELRLKTYAPTEIAAGTTLVGPHRDDFSIESGTESQESRRDLAVYGSRGEQRMAVLALKTAELAFVEEKTGERPLLLLDDIFSELDETHRAQVLKLAGRQQTIITTTDANLVAKSFRDTMEVIKL
jgi:DNA replication and repair protein RecF